MLCLKLGRSSHFSLIVQRTTQVKGNYFPSRGLFQSVFTHQVCSTASLRTSVLPCSAFGHHHPGQDHNSPWMSRTSLTLSFTDSANLVMMKIILHQLRHGRQDKHATNHAMCAESLPLEWLCTAQLNQVLRASTGARRALAQAPAIPAINKYMHKPCIN
jgi:hypothetical protein